MLGLKTGVATAAVQTRAAIALTLTTQRDNYRLLHHSAPRERYVRHAQQVRSTNLTTNFSSQQGENCKAFSLRAPLCSRSSTTHGHAHRALHRSFVQQKKSSAYKPSTSCHRAAENRGPMLAGRIQCLPVANAPSPGCPLQPPLPADTAPGSCRAPHICASAGPCECS